MLTALADLCRATADELRALGVPELVAVADAAVSVATVNPELDGCFALDLLAAFPGEGALVGRLLDVLRSRADGSPKPKPNPKMTLREAVAEYEAGAFLRLAKSSRDHYARSYKRLVDAYGDRPVDGVRTGDLTGLVARLTARDDPHGHFHGKGAARTTISAYRTLWTHFDDQGYADGRVAQRVKKPALPPTKRRALTHGEMQVVRQIANEARDPERDTCVVILCQTVLMRKMEVVNAEIGNYRRDRRVLGYYGKGNKWRETPVAPRAAAFLDAFIEARRPADVDPAEWWASSEKLVRSMPSAKHPRGKPLDASGWDAILQRFQTYAPNIFNKRDVALHSFRHSAGTWLERHFGKAVAAAALGHSHENATDAYTKATVEEVRHALAMYEEWVYGDGQPTAPSPQPLYPPPTTAEIIRAA